MTASDLAAIIYIALSGAIAYVIVLIARSDPMDVVRQMVEDYHYRPKYQPRHRAVGPSTMQRVRTQRRARALTEATELLDGLSDASHDAEELDRPRPGVKAYRQLRTAALDSTAERFMRIVEAGDILPPSPWGTPSVVDEWDPIPEGVDGYAIAGRTR